SALFVGNIPQGFTSAHADKYTGNTLNGHNYDFYLYPTWDDNSALITAGNFGSSSTTFFRDYKNGTGYNAIGYLLDKLVTTSKFTNNSGFGFGLLFDSRDPGTSSGHDHGRENYLINGNSITNVSYWGDPGNWGSVDVRSGTGPGTPNTTKGFYRSRTINAAPNPTYAVAGSGSTNASP
ncbi:MAG: hypothetical protein LBB47_02965, partial [Spirochaetaceae bacterium]|nr:hypothetical protein [Spirochaetaceae bacterium]